MDGSVYDVFISFRGIDTRTGFTGSLHRALCGKQIKSFMDDHNLEKGAEINPALDNAIQTSRIALVILSKNYASSTFCLDELEKIMDCSKDKGMLVLPVFYEVDPSDVRYQKGKYADSLNKHEARIIDEKEKIEKWRFALKKISYFSGWNLKDYRYEYELIDIIVEDIIKKIHRLRDGEKEKHVTKPKNIENLVQDMIRAIKGIQRYDASGSSQSSLRPVQVPQRARAFLCFKAGLRHLELGLHDHELDHVSDAWSCFDESLSLLAKKQKEKILIYFKSWKKLL